MEEERTQRLEVVETHVEEPQLPADPETPPDTPHANVWHPEPSASLPRLEPPVAYVSLGLTVGDGFKFGCGLVMAVAIATVGLVVLASVVFLIASLIGLPVPIGQ